MDRFLPSVDRGSLSAADRTALAFLDYYSACVQIDGMAWETALTLTMLAMDGTPNAVTRGILALAVRNDSVGDVEWGGAL